MARNGPIIFVEDDLDDQDFVREVLQSLNVKNELIFFTRATEALAFLQSGSVQPFLIVSDVNLPLMTGLEFKKQIDTDPELRARSIPFVFLSTSVGKAAVNDAYQHLTVQGFFEKSTNLDGLRNTLKLIIDYWLVCRHPNSDY